MIKELDTQSLSLRLVYVCVCFVCYSTFYRPNQGQTKGMYLDYRVLTVAMPVRSVRTVVDLPI